MVYAIEFTTWCWALLGYPNSAYSWTPRLWLRRRNLPLRLLGLLLLAAAHHLQRPSRRRKLIEMGGRYKEIQHPKVITLRNLWKNVFYIWKRQILGSHSLFSAEFALVIFSHRVMNNTRVTSPIARSSTRPSVRWSSDVSPVRQPSWPTVSVVPSVP